MDIDSLVQAIRRISIRGRVALGIICLERLIDHLQVRNDALDRLLEQLWRSVEEFNLGTRDATFPLPRR